MAERFVATVGGDAPLEPGALPLLEVPATVVEALGGAQKPRVRVTLNGHTYRSTVAVYDGRFYLPVNRENKARSGVELGDAIEVTLDRDDAPRTVEIPADLAATLADSPGARERFEALSYTARRERVEALLSAKREETRARRLATIVGELA
ncbi:MAG: hypothetical protein QOE92_1810 [Chloroflexota bacterium]|nr:hypothetical protein [Chloroflexota bacterium]